MCSGNPDKQTNESTNTQQENQKNRFALNQTKFGCTVVQFVFSISSGCIVGGFTWNSSLDNGLEDPKVTKRADGD